MPVVIPKAPALLKPVDLSPQPAAPAGLTRAEVEAMLAARDAVWERRLSDLAAMLAQKPAPAAPPPPPRKGAKIEFKTDMYGQITGADIIPRD